MSSANNDRFAKDILTSSHSWATLSFTQTRWPGRHFWNGKKKKNQLLDQRLLGQHGLGWVPIMVSKGGGRPLGGAFYKQQPRLQLVLKSRVAFSTDTYLYQYWYSIDVIIIFMAQSEASLILPWDWAYWVLHVGSSGCPLILGLCFFSIFASSFPLSLFGPFEVSNSLPLLALIHPYLFPCLSQCVSQNISLTRWSQQTEFRVKQAWETLPTMSTSWKWVSTLKPLGSPSVFKQPVPRPAEARSVHIPH